MIMLHCFVTNFEICHFEPAPAEEGHFPNSIGHYSNVSHYSKTTMIFTSALQNPMILKGKMTTRILLGQEGT